MGGFTKVIICILCQIMTTCLISKFHCLQYFLDYQLWVFVRLFDHIIIVSMQPLPIMMLIFLGCLLTV